MARDEDRENDKDEADRDNRSRQLNEEHDAYWQSRGYSGRPDDNDDDD
jgi:hypothetical protein